MEESEFGAQLLGERIGRSSPPPPPPQPGGSATEGLRPGGTPDPGPTDSELLRRAAGGDGRAFHDLVDRHAKRLYRLAFSLVGNAADAEDVVQETFAGAFRGLGRFEERASVKTWLTRILVTQAAKWHRDRKRRRDDRPLEEGGAGPGMEGGAGGVDRRIDLYEAMRQLSPAHREVLALRELDLMAYEEIAAVLGLPRGTVESRLHRARAELRERLKAYLP